MNQNPFRVLWSFTLDRIAISKVGNFAIAPEYAVRSTAPWIERVQSDCIACLFLFLCSLAEPESSYYSFGRWRGVWQRLVHTL